MEIETEFIKKEPADEIINEHGSSNFNNEEICSTSFNCKNEPYDSFTNEETELKLPALEIDDIFDEGDLVDLSKLKQLLNQSKNIPEYNNMKYEDKDFAGNSILDKKPIIKQEEEKCDISEDPLKLSESSDCTSEEKDHKEICLDMFNTDNIQNIKDCSENLETEEKIDILEHTLDISEDLGTLEPNQPRHKKKKIHKCNLCSYQAMVKTNLVRHFNTNHNTNKIKLNCHFCDKSFVFKYSLEDHLLKEHKWEIKDDMNRFITSKILKCNICAYETTHTGNLKQHINSMHNEQRIRIHCQFCYKSFAFKNSLDDHLLKQHKGEIKGDVKDFLTTKILKCSICPFETTVTNSLTVHINSFHKKQKIRRPCQFCDKSFSNQMFLDDHVVKQHKEEIHKVRSKIHTCKVCSFQTTVKSSMDCHFNTAHAKEKFKVNCQFCERTFGVKKSLTNHLLKQHRMEIKSDIKSFITHQIYKCDHCDFETTITSSLKKHINAMHNEQRIKIACQFCDKSFALQISLDDHLVKKHNKEEIHKIETKFHKCNICSYQTTGRSSLVRHILAVHNKDN